MSDLSPEQVIDWKAKFEKLAAAGDVLAHQLVYDNQYVALLEKWWEARGGYAACSVCNPPESRFGHE